VDKLETSAALAGDLGGLCAAVGAVTAGRKESRVEILAAHGWMASALSFFNVLLI
jgi:hypothetical protein